jgi:hypothetical protein
LGEPGRPDAAQRRLPTGPAPIAQHQAWYRTWEHASAVHHDAGSWKSRIRDFVVLLAVGVQDRGMNGLAAAVGLPAEGFKFGIGAHRVAVADVGSAHSQRCHDRAPAGSQASPDFDDLPGLTDRGGSSFVNTAAGRMNAPSTTNVGSCTSA